MHNIMRIFAILLLGMMAVAHTTPVDARKAKASEQTVEARAEAEQREKEKKALQKFEKDAQEFALYQECAVKTKAIENAYLESADAKSSDPTSTDEYLFRSYLRTVKWDKDGCFEWKDPAAAKKVGRSLKDYVIGGVHPVLKDQLRRLFVELETQECSPGLKCKPGITSAFRDDYRQHIASGYKARTGNSNHGGSKVTKGWGDGRAFDVVNISDPEIFGDERFSASEALWKHIDKLGPKVGIYRPMRARDPMHVQSMGWLRSLIESGKRTIEEVIGTTKEMTADKIKKNTEEAIDKFKKKK